MRLGLGFRIRRDIVRKERLQSARVREGAARLVGPQQFHRSHVGRKTRRLLLHVVAKISRQIPQQRRRGGPAGQEVGRVQQQLAARQLICGFEAATDVDYWVAARLRGGNAHGGE